LASKEQKGKIIGWFLSFLGILLAVALTIGLNLALYMAFPNPLIGLAFMALVLVTVLIVYFLLLSLISSKFGIYLPIKNPFRRRKEEQPEMTPPAGGRELMEEGLMSSGAPIAYPTFQRDEPKITTTKISAVHFKYITRLEGKYPDVYVGVIEDPETGGVKYVVIEPEMNEKEVEAYKRIVGFLEEELEVDVESLKSREEAKQYVKSKISEIIRKHRIRVPRSSLNKFMYYFERDFLGLGKIEPLMHDPMIEDISCDGVGIPVYIWHREFESIPTNIMFESEKELDSFIIRLAHLSGRHISLANPIVDATLPDGSRIQLTLGKEVTQKGSTFTIRKFRADPLTVTDLIKYRTMSTELAAYFWYAIEKRFSILVAGGTASGKTTTLNVLSMFILPDLKIVSIEDTRELNLPHKNWIPSVTRTGFGETEMGEITLFDLLKASLRQRPDIIIVGEVRGEEAYTLLQAAATGHGGLSTIHADSVKAVIERLSTPPMNVPKPLIASALHIIAMQLKLRIGNRSVRRITHVAEIVRYDHGKDDIVLNDVFKWDPVADTHKFLKKSHIFKLIQERYGEQEEEIKRAIEMRKTVLEWMVKKDIRNYRDVSKVIREFYTDPEGVYTRARGELSIERKI
jgi:flagellar protein FlaI